MTIGFIWAHPEAQVLDLENFSMWTLFGSLIFSSIGLWLWRQAKNRDSTELLIISVVMIGYSYFTPSARLTWGIGVVLCFLAKRAWDK